MGTFWMSWPEKRATSAVIQMSPFSYRLILLKSGWHVVANGYLCKVTDEKEGQRALADLRTTSLRNQPSIDKA